MYENPAEVGWTENQWNTVQRTVAEEAQKARVGRRFLPIVGPLAPEVTAVAPLTLTNTNADPNTGALNRPAPPMAVNRLEVDTYPTLRLATISTLVELPKSQISDPELAGALTMFRRAANYVARVEDALIFNGQPAADTLPGGIAGIPAVVRLTGGGVNPGIFVPLPPTPPPQVSVLLPAPLSPAQLVANVIAATTALQGIGQFGPFHLLVSPGLYSLVTSPTPNLIMPLDRIPHHLEGGSIFNSTMIPATRAAVVAGNGSPLEIVVGSEICVSFLQLTLEPRWVFRVSERIALRIKENQAIADLY